MSFHFCYFLIMSDLINFNQLGIVQPDQRIKQLVNSGSNVQVDFATPILRWVLKFEIYDSSQEEKNYEIFQFITDTTGAEMKFIDRQKSIYQKATCQVLTSFTCVSSLYFLINYKNILR